MLSHYACSPIKKLSEKYGFSMSMEKKTNKKSQRRHVKRFRACTAVLIVLKLLLLMSSPFSVRAQAQENGFVPKETIEIPSSWNPVGSGARALGMGGAFIAVADDATAASWNPGGLIQLEKPEISVVGSYFYRREENTFGTNPEASGTQSVSFSDLNYLSLAYPFSIFNRNMVIALTYQNLFDFNREAKFTLTEIDVGEIATVSYDSNIDICHEGNLSAVGFSYSLSLTHKLSFGFTLNFWEDWLGNHAWNETTRQLSTGVLDFGGFFQQGFRSQIEEKKEFSFSGLNANLGFLWRITDNLTMGGVLKTPFTADLDIKTESKILVQLGDVPVDPELSTTYEDADLDMPLSYGIGLSYRFSDAFTVDADVYRTEWDDFLLKRASGNISPITGLPEGESDIDPTTQVRLGLEYLFIQPPYVIPLRGGVFYDPAPAEGSPDDFYGVSLGSGIVWKRIVFDIAYQFRWGNNVNAALHRDRDFSSDLQEHSVYYSLILHF
jgi:hypothetical protein